MDDRDDNDITLLPYLPEDDIAETYLDMLDGECEREKLDDGMMVPMLETRELDEGEPTPGVGMNVLILDGAKYGTSGVFFFGSVNVSKEKSFNRCICLSLNAVGMFFSYRSLQKSAHLDFRPGAYNKLSAVFGIYTGFFSHAIPVFKRASIVGAMSVGDPAL